MELTPQSAFQLTTEISPLLVHLLKGVLYQDRNPELWADLLRYMGPARKYFGLIGLEVFLDESEGYAFLRQTEVEDDETTPLPRLIQRRQLSYPMSLLLVLLRKKLVELDAGGTETRLIVSRDQIIEMLRVFLAETSNEAKLVNVTSINWWISVFCVNLKTMNENMRFTVLCAPWWTASGSTILMPD